PVIGMRGKGIVICASIPIIAANKAMMVILYNLFACILSLLSFIVHLLYFRLTIKSIKKMILAVNSVVAEKSILRSRCFHTPLRKMPEFHINEIQLFYFLLR